MPLHDGTHLHLWRQDYYSCDAKINCRENQAEKRRMRAKDLFSDEFTPRRLVLRILGSIAINTNLRSKV